MLNIPSNQVIHNISYITILIDKFKEYCGDLRIFKVFTLQSNGKTIICSPGIPYGYCPNIMHGKDVLPLSTHASKGGLFRQTLNQDIYGREPEEYFVPYSDTL